MTSILPSRVISFGSKRYRASLKSVVPKADLEELRKIGKCLLGVSLGSSRFEGAQLEGSIEWISENFKSCGLVVGDHIYRLTLQLLHGLEPEQARQRAIEVGQEFIQTYAPLLRQYSHDCIFEFIPMSATVKSPNYLPYLETLQQLHRNSSEFQASVLAFSELYLGRGEKEVHSTRAVEISQAYLMEEAALFACLQEQGWNCLVYPGSIDSIADLVCGKFPQAPSPLQKLTFASLDLRQKGLYFADGTQKVIVASDDHSPNTTSGGTEFLSQLSDDQWALFMKHTKIKRFAPRELILQSQGQDHHLCFLMGGRAEVTVTRGDGSHQQLSILEQGTVFGELSFLDDQPRSADVRALVECEVRTISQKEFAAFRLAHPEICCDIYADISRILSARCRRQTFELQHVI